MTAAEARCQTFDIPGETGEAQPMATTNPEERLLAPGAVGAAVPIDESDLLAEILAAEADFERGDYIELTPEQLRRAIETGESPWPDESPG